jgi:two-component system, chemotaxis family, CheB/CheR fusion protein
MSNTGMPPLRVLVVDDARDALMLLGIVLRSEGMLVRLAERGTEVDEAVADFNPDVVLLDIEMPDRSGLEVAVGLRQRLGERCPALIAVTGHNTEAARRLTAKSGFRHHVAKPYDFDAMVRLVASTAKNADLPS